MKVIMQKVSRASVLVKNEIISSIGKGTCIFVGFSKHDTRKDLECIVQKILNLEIFEDDNGKEWSKSIKDKQLEILCISQFSLCNTLKGNRLDFHPAMAAEKSIVLYKEFLSLLRSIYNPELVKEGRFGVYRHIDLQNDGPVTVLLDSLECVDKEDNSDESPLLHHVPFSSP